jgi:hypothetical protein
MPVLDLAAAETTLYVCRVCGAQAVPLDRMSKSNKRGRMMIYGACLSCSNARKRRAEQERAAAPRSEDGTVIEPVTASDPAPARLLADLLREDRGRWAFPFDVAWEESVTFVLGRLSAAERQSWRDAFEQTREAWQAAWSEAPDPGAGLEAELIDALSEPARR